MKPIRLFLCVLLGWALSSAMAWSQAMPRRANIILIVADGLGAGDLSCYGQTQFQTPSLDKLAAGGIRFTNYIAGGLANSPAFASLVLGKNTSYLPDVDLALDSGDITIAQLLKNSDYNTCLMGEWNLGDQNSEGAPWKHGFGEFVGYFNATDAANPQPKSVWHYVMTTNPTTFKKETVNTEEPIYKNAGAYSSDLLTDWAINYIRNHQPQWFNHYRSFFLVLHYTIPGNGNCVIPSDAPFSEEAWPQQEKNRAAAIARLDGYIGQLTEQLDKFNQTSNTVVFFTSSTAPQKGGGIDPNFFHENAPNDYHVPMIVSWPGKIRAGQVSGLECSARDFMPTAAALADLQATNVDGTSFSPVLFRAFPSKLQR